MEQKTVLLLHGGGLSRWNFRAVAGAMGDGYRVILPVLDGHAGSEHDFTSIEDNAQRLIDRIDAELGGHVAVLGGLSLGAQVALEMLARRPDVCGHAILESASVIPSRATAALLGPSVAASYGLIRRRWFARMQAAYLRIPEDLFGDYYRDSCAMTRENLTRVLRASTLYALPEGLEAVRARVRIVVGGREQAAMKRSARLLHELIPGSALEIRPGLRHGEYSLCTPQAYADDLKEMLS